MFRGFAFAARRRDDAYSLKYSEEAQRSCGRKDAED
jgi:hypothetical protein